MAEKFNLQDRFLNILRINKIEVKIYLEGDYTVLLEKNGEQSLVYKHAIKMMAPSKYIKLFQEQSSKDE